MRRGNLGGIGQCVLTPSTLAALAVAACAYFAESEPSRLVVSPLRLEFVGVAGGLDPPARFLTIASVGSGVLRWQAAADVPWVTFETSRGEAPDFLRVTASSAGLALGDHTGMVVIKNVEETVDVVTVPVVLELGSAPSVAGRWVGRADTISIALSVGQRGDTVTGSASLNPPPRVALVDGRQLGAAVTLTLVTAPRDTLRFSGSFRDDNTLSGLLAGLRPVELPVTFDRQ